MARGTAGVATAEGLQAWLPTWGAGAEVAAMWLVGTKEGEGGGQRKENIMKPADIT